MPLFKDNETLTIVYRQYEYNAEALDGKITKIDDTNKCVALRHLPNTSWTYDVVPIQKGYADIIWEAFNKKIQPKPTSPEIFINIVPLGDVHDYINHNNYRLVGSVEEVTAPINKPTINIKPPIKSNFKQSPRIETIESISSEYGVKLVRDKESATYKFKSPNLR